MSDIQQPGGLKDSNGTKGQSNIVADSLSNKVKRTHIVAGEFRVKETNEAGNYNAYEVFLQGELVGYFYCRKEAGLKPSKLHFKREIEVETVY